MPTLSKKSLLSAIKRVAKSASTKRLAGDIQAALKLDSWLDTLVRQAEVRGFGDDAVDAEDAGRQSAAALPSARRNAPPLVMRLPADVRALIAQFTAAGGDPEGFLTDFGVQGYDYPEADYVVSVHVEQDSVLGELARALRMRLDPYFRQYREWYAAILRESRPARKNLFGLGKSVDPADADLKALRADIKRFGKGAATEEVAREIEVRRKLRVSGRGSREDYINAVIVALGGRPNKSKTNIDKEMLDRYYQKGRNDDAAARYLHARAQKLLPGVRLEDAVSVVAQHVYGGGVTPALRQAMVSEGRVRANRKNHHLTSDAAKLDYVYRAMEELRASAPMLFTKRLP